MSKRTFAESNRAPLVNDSQLIPAWDLTGRQLCDLELLMSGALAPLTKFMGRDEYESVLTGMHLSDGTFWPMPITLEA